MLRRYECWELYRGLCENVDEFEEFVGYEVGMKACLLLFITRLALQSQCPGLQVQWVRDGVAPPQDVPLAFHVGNLWSNNFLSPQLQRNVDEMCPNRHGILSYRPPYDGFRNLDAVHLMEGRLMMSFPLTAREKSGQCQWRGQYAQVRPGLSHQIVNEGMLIRWLVDI